MYIWGTLCWLSSISRTAESVVIVSFLKAHQGFPDFLVRRLSLIALTFDINFYKVRLRNPKSRRKANLSLQRWRIYKTFDSIHKYVKAERLPNIFPMSSKVLKSFLFAISTYRTLLRPLVELFQMLRHKSIKLNIENWANQSGDGIDNWFLWKMMSLINTWVACFLQLCLVLQSSKEC